MKFVKFLSVFLLLTLLHNSSLAALDTAPTADMEEKFPKIGFIKNDGANVRAGDNVNFESLCKLKKGSPIKIIGKRYSWYNIILPKKAHLYIKSDYVELSSKKKIGEVNATRVNLRAGPGTKYSILGQVSKPEKLKVLSETDGWYEIEPPEETKGWINHTQIMFGLEGI